MFQDIQQHEERSQRCSVGMLPIIHAFGTNKPIERHGEQCSCKVHFRKRCQLKISFSFQLKFDGQI